MVKIKGNHVTKQEFIKQMLMVILMKGNHLAKQEFIK